MLGRAYGQILADHGFADEFDLVLAVPLHKSRLRMRGYNQSLHYAKGLAETLLLPCVDEAVVRQTRTESQTRRTKLQRWQNVKDVFRVADGDVVRGKRILLVDDIITTGATLEACGQVLLSAGCQEVSFVCIAAAN